MRFLLFLLLIPFFVFNSIAEEYGIAFLKKKEYEIEMNIKPVDGKYRIGDDLELLCTFKNNSEHIFKIMDPEKNDTEDMFSVDLMIEGEEYPCETTSTVFVQYLKKDYVILHPGKSLTGKIKFKDFLSKEHFNNSTGYISIKDNMSKGKNFYLNIDYHGWGEFVDKDGKFLEAKCFIGESKNVPIKIDSSVISFFIVQINDIYWKYFSSPLSLIIFAPIPVMWIIFYLTFRLSLL